MSLHCLPCKRNTVIIFIETLAQARADQSEVVSVNYQIYGPLTVTNKAFYCTYELHRRLNIPTVHVHSLQ